MTTPESTLPAAGSEVGEAMTFSISGNEYVDAVVHRSMVASLRAQLAAAISERDEWMEASEKLAIRATTAESALSAQRREWIPVGERLPKHWERVFVFGNRDHEMAYYHNPDGGTVGEWYDGEDEVFNVTHWMPLPSSPQATDTQK